MSKLAEILMVAIVPLLVGFYSAPLDLTADDEQSSGGALDSDSVALAERTDVHPTDTSGN